jgi:hypothetical protein
MHKLRELISAKSAAWDKYDATGQTDHDKFSVYCETYLRLQSYVANHVEQYADLIDAAQHVVDVCTVGMYGNDGNLIGTRVPMVHDINLLRDALAKLEK